MMQVIRSNERFTHDAGWLQTRWHFSFSHYHDPANMNFGPLRVFNDDVVQPGGGFPTHGHAEMEILTYVISGALEHRDSSGGHGVLRAGDVQHMTAGRGIRHSEYNPSATEPVQLLQLWFMPRQRGLTPGYQQQHFAATPGTLVPVASGWSADGALPLEADATVYVGQLPQGTRARQALRGSRGYVFVIAGSVEINGQQLHAGDQARITGETDIALAATGDAHVMAIDLA